VRLVFAGTPDAAVPSLEALLDSRHDVVAVVTRPDRPAGRGRRLTPSPVGALAAARDLEVLTPAKPSDPQFLARLAQIAPRCCPVVAYGALLPRAALDIAPHGWVNLHFSLLPAWRGAAPVQRAVMAGDELTGATTFRIVEALDAGPTYGQLVVPIRPDDTAGTVLDRLARDGAGLLVSTIDGIEDETVVERPQPVDGISLAPKLTVEEAEVDWTEPAFAVDRRIRGCSPAPGPWTLAGPARLKLGPVTALPEVTDLPPSGLRVTKNLVEVGTATHAVGLTVVQPAGKGWTPAPDWARGLREAPSRLGR
jgi:methionyl-tRNA formyltransferase